MLNCTAVVLSYCLSVLSVTAADHYSVPFVRCPQVLSEWCWVASAKCSALHLYNSDKSQADAVKYIKGEIINEGGTVQEMAQAAEYFTNNTYNYSGYNTAYSYAVFKGEIMNDTVPMAVGGYYINGVETEVMQLLYTRL